MVTLRSPKESKRSKSKRSKHGQRFQSQALLSRGCATLRGEHSNMAVDKNLMDERLVVLCCLFYFCIVLYLVASGPWRCKCRCSALARTLSLSLSLSPVPLRLKSFNDHVNCGGVKSSRRFETFADRTNRCKQIALRRE